MKKAGIIIIILGLILTIFTAVTIFTREKVVDLGAIKITRDKPHKYNWSPLIGLGVMGVGGILFIMDSKSRKAI